MVDFSTKDRARLAKIGQAMPDGGYPIQNVADLKRAIASYGRGTNKTAVKKWIKKRAKELDAEKLLPSNWEVRHMERVLQIDELQHYGVLGMKWGHRKARKAGTTFDPTSRRTKRLQKKADRANRRGATKEAIYLKGKAQESARQDKRMAKYASKASVGKSLLASAVFGPIMKGGYSRLRANGVSKGRAAVATYLTGGLAGYAADAINRSTAGDRAVRKSGIDKAYRNS